MNLLLNFPWLASGLVYLGFFVLGGILFAPLWIIAYKAFMRKLLPDAIRARKTDRLRVKKANEKVHRMHDLMEKQFAIVREMRYQLDEVRKEAIS